VTRNVVTHQARARVKRGIDRDCWVCGNPDWRWREGKRKDAKTCSNRCRQRGYQLRRLFRDGYIKGQTERDPSFRAQRPDHPIWDKLTREYWRKGREQG